MLQELPSPEASEIQNPESRHINPFERIRLGGDELAICSRIVLVPNEDYPERNVNLILIDVGFRKQSEKYGPYDIDGSGKKRLFNKQYVLVRAEHTADGINTRTYEFNSGEEILLGRESNEDAAKKLGFFNNTFVSRSHAKIEINKHGDINIEDVGSKNGTEIKSAGEILGNVSTNYGYTTNIGDYVSNAGHGRSYKSQEEAEGWGKGEFAGRPIIARDTPINEGVYPVGGRHGEALVVDDVKYPKELNEVYARVVDKQGINSVSKFSLKALKKSLRRKTDDADEISDELKSVFGVVSQVLKYDLASTNAIAKDYQKITINTYIHEGVGVCRTQALLSAYLVERLIKNGYLDGRISVDRNMDHDVAGGHSWGRYTNKDGEVYIIDPAQRYIGKINKMGSKTTWDYRRSEDLMRELLAA